MCFLPSNQINLLFLAPYHPLCRCMSSNSGCLGCRLKTVSHFVGPFKRSELLMAAHGAFLHSKSLQSIYLSSYCTVFPNLMDQDKAKGMPGSAPFIVAVGRKGNKTILLQSLICNKRAKKICRIPLRKQEKLLFSPLICAFHRTFPLWPQTLNLKAGIC